VWLGLPAGLLQSGGGLRIAAAMARWWSSSGELQAMWPKKRSRLLVTMLDSGWQFWELLARMCLSVAVKEQFCRGYLSLNWWSSFEEIPSLIGTKFLTKTRHWTGSIIGWKHQVSYLTWAWKSCVS